MSSGWKKDEPPETQWVRLPSKHDTPAAPKDAPKGPVFRRRAPGRASPDAPPDADSPFAHHQRPPTQTLMRVRSHSRSVWVVLMVILLLGLLAAVGGYVIFQNLPVQEEPQVVG